MVCEAVVLFCLQWTDGIKKNKPEGFNKRRYSVKITDGMNKVL